MKKMLFALLLVLSFVVPAYAHSGGTDSNGGHYVGGTSEYHYHHGKPAHQHDNDICPYANDEQDDAQSPRGNTMQSVGGNIDFTPWYEKPETQKPPEPQSLFKLILTAVFISIVFAPIFTPIFFYVLMQPISYLIKKIPIQKVQDLANDDKESLFSYLIYLLGSFIIVLLILIYHN